MNDSIPLSYYLILCAGLFSIGLAISIVKRHIILVLMGIEIMLNAVNISLVGFSRNDTSLFGQNLSLFILVVAAAEAVVALSIILLVYKHFKSVHLDDFSELVN
jgi:NADH:ubiquinone oxidoreductase subunit K